MTTRTKTKILRALLFCIPLFYSAQACAAVQEDQWSETIKLVVGQTRSIQVSSPTKVVIANPVVADVTDVTSQEVIVNAKSPGITNLTLNDNFGESIIRLKVVSEDMNDVKLRADNLLKNFNLPEVYTQAEDEEGKIFILGMVDSQEDKDKINAGLTTLGSKLVNLVKIKENDQVIEIDVQVIEVDRDSSKTLGITWPSSVSITEQGSPALATSAQTQVGTSTTIAGGASLGTPWSTLFRVLNVSRGSFALKLDALITEGKARILSRPRLSCQSGKKAKLLVGGEKPVMTSEISSVGTRTKVEYKEYGIKLSIQPTISEEDRIKLNLDVDVSDVGDAETLGSSSAPTARAYPLTKRTASTELYVENGQTLSIGGLIRQKQEENVTKVPLLGDLPLLGKLFQSKSYKTGGGAGTKGDTELFIIMTPSIVGGPKAKNNIAGAKANPPVNKNTAEDSPLDRLKYAQIVQMRLTENLIYPFDAQRAGFQGTVKLSLHISASGKLLEAAVKESSGYKVLDDNAILEASRISAYPPFPLSMNNTDIWIDIPITYNLINPGR